MRIIWSLIVGGVAGWLAGQMMKGGGYGLLANIALGIVGGIIGDLVFGVLGLAATHLLGRIICATVGAVLLIVVVRAVRK